MSVQYYNIMLQFNNNSYCIIWCTIYERNHIYIISKMFFFFRLYINITVCDNKIYGRESGYYNINKLYDLILFLDVRSTNNSIY